MPTLDGHRARAWLAGILAGWTLLLLAVSGYRAWASMSSAACPTDESVAAFCHAQAFSSSLDALKWPAVVYAIGLVALALGWVWTMSERSPGGAD